jgi:hypothetical protein
MSSLAEHNEARSDMVDDDELIPSDEAAPIIKVKPKTLPQWRHLGRGPVYVRSVVESSTGVPLSMPGWQSRSATRR